MEPFFVTTFISETVLLLLLLGILGVEIYRVYCLQSATLGMDSRSKVITFMKSNIKHKSPFYLFICQIYNLSSVVVSEERLMILSEIQSRIRNCLPKTCFVELLRNHEFAIIVSADNPIEPENIARRIIDVFSSTFDGNVYAIVLDACTGYCSYPDDAQSVKRLLIAGDMALQYAKTHGLSISRYSHEMSERMHNRLVMMAEIRRGLNEDEFEPWFQPRVSTAQNRGVLSVEALARWRKSDGSIVPPFDFIELAEESGLILELGTRILEKACSTGARWLHQYGDLAPGISVNVSPKQLHGNFAGLVTSALKKSGLPGDRLELEITESGLVSNITEVQALLKDLKQIGVRVSIDDFGTGYSSLSYLPDFEVHSLKIDASFIRRISESNSSCAVVDMIVQMAQRLNMRIIAEGVETEDQRRIISEMGCHEIQGFFYAKPMPEEMYEEWFADFQKTHTIEKHDPNVSPGGTQ